jgi:uncharacterized membrane protein YfcA
MPDPLALAALVTVSIFVFTVAGVVGFGGGVVILPILVWSFGPREAIPMIAIVQSMSIIARSFLNRREVSWPVVKWFAVGAVPVSLIASFLFLITPATILVRVLGFLILLLVAYRRTSWGRKATIRLRAFAPIGAGVGFVSGFLGTPGPMAAPFFLSHGLSGRAYIGTFSACLLVTQVPKMAVFGSNALFNNRVLLVGFGIGSIAFLGALLGRFIMGKIPQRWVEFLIEGLMVMGGVLLLAKG